MKHDAGRSPAPEQPLEHSLTRPATPGASPLIRPHVADILESITDAFFAVDLEWRFVYVNRHAEEVWRRSRHDLLGRRVLDVFPHLRGSDAHRAMLRAMRDEETVHYEGRSPVRDMWIEAHIYPSPSGFSCYFRDIAERKRAEEGRRFLADVGSAATTALDVATILGAVARRCVDGFADCCVIDLLDDEGAPHRAAAAHRDGEGADALVARVLAVGPGVPVPDGVLDVLHSGRASLRANVAVPPIGSDASAALERDVGATSVIVAPLLARGRILGALSLMLCAGERRFDARDLVLAEEAAHRVALASDNARLYAMAQDASRAKSDFLATISHELRTPLTAILGFADLLSEEVFGPVPEVQKEQIDRIKAAGEHLQLLVEELLSFAKLETGREVVSLANVELSEVIADTRALIQPLARRKALRFVVQIPERPVTMQTDHRKVCQILLNLLANAVKFTETGELGLRAREVDANVEFEVWDTGIGIPREHIEHIFDPFWQVEQHLARRAGGTGLGLTVVRKLAMLLGGSVAVESEPDRGSRFTVQLPMRSEA
ncbi:MAG: ATP-binding protein [Gemmatimonadaceae bacterium]